MPIKCHAGTYENHRRYLKSFLESIGRSAKIAAVKKHHVLSWAERYPTSTSQNDAIAIVQPLVKKHPTGPLFRNTRGNAWTKDAIKDRLTRISEKVGFRVIAYGARHSYATNALIRAVDSVSLSHLLGHKDTRMVNNYAHLVGNTEFLKQQALRASGKRTGRD